MSEHESNQETNGISQIKGTVKWFDPRKGYGFIVGPKGQDIFVHYTVIDGEGFRVLKDGSVVTYDAEHNDKGWRAVKIYREEDEQGEDGDDSATEPEAVEVIVPRKTYSRTPRR